MKLVNRYLAKNNKYEFMSMEEIYMDYNTAIIAHRDEKDYEKAIYYYKLSIKKKVCKKVCLNNIFDIYISLEKYDEALKMLESYQQYIDNNDFLYYKLKIFCAFKKSNNFDEIVDTFDKFYETLKTKRKKVDLRLSEALLMNQLGYYNNAIELYMDLLNNINDFNDRIKEERQKINSLIGICYAYYKLKDIDNTKKYAKYILEINEKNIFAYTINNFDNYELYFDALEPEDVLENYGLNDQDYNYIESFDLSAVFNKSEYSYNIINEFDDFVGTEEDAIKLLDSVVDFDGKKHFAFAKIIKQILNRDEEIKYKDKINEKEMFLNIAKGYFRISNLICYLKDKYNHYSKSFIGVETLIIDPPDSYFFLKATNALYFFKKSISIYEGLNVKDAYYNYAIDYCSNTDNFGMTRNLNKDQKKLIGLNLYFNNDVEKFNKMILDYNCQFSIKKLLKKMIFCYVEDFFNADHDKSLRQNIEYDIKNYFLLTGIVNSINLPFFNFFYPNFVKFFKLINKYIDKNIERKIANIKYFDYLFDESEKIISNINNNPTEFENDVILPVVIHFRALTAKYINEIYLLNKPEIEIDDSDKFFFDKDNKLLKINLKIKIKNRVIKILKIQLYSNNYTFRDLSNTSAFSKAFTVNVPNHKIFDGYLELYSIIEYGYYVSKNRIEWEKIRKNIILPLDEFEKIDNKFRHNISKVNDEDMFFGRDEIVNDIVDDLINTGNGKYIALYGQYRSGKTTILNFIEKKLRKDDNNIIANLHSLARIGSEKSSNSEIEFGIMRSIVAIFEKEIKNNKTLSEEYSKYEISKVDIKNELKENKNESDISNIFFGFLEDMISALKEINPSLRFYIFIDEFTSLYEWIRLDRISKKEEKDKIDGRVLLILKDLVENLNVSIVLVGQDNMVKFVSEFSNEFGGVDFKEVTYLDKKDALKMIDEPVKYNRDGKLISRYLDDTLENIYNLTAGSAFLIAQMCSELINYMNKNERIFVTKELLNCFIEEYLNDINIDSKRLFHPLYTDLNYVGEQQADRINQNIQLLDKIILDDLTESNENKELLDELVKRKVICYNEGKYKIIVDLYAKWRERVIKTADK
ncbi:MAG: hypothetical protein IJ224_05025 [Lachnospiraceae bacterium]|nr:hypothetical protein [Lachnospiraceae bacterium]